MLHDAVSDPESHTPEELLAAYEAELQAVVERLGADAVAAETDVEAERLTSLLADETPTDETAAEFTLEEAAAIRALDDDAPDAETIVLEVRDHLLLGMTTGVVDVDTLASNVDLNLTGQEIQQAIEGRVPMTLRQLAAIQQFLAERSAR